MKKLIRYKGFYLVTCISKFQNRLVGTLYSKRFNHGIYYYTKTHYGETEDSLVIKMKEEADKLIEKEKKYLENQIEESKSIEKYLISRLESLINETDSRSNESIQKDKLSRINEQAYQLKIGNKEYIIDIKNDQLFKVVHTA